MRPCQHVRLQANGPSPTTPCLERTTRKCWRCREKDGEDSWEANMAGDTSDPDRPVGGWLVLACFHAVVGSSLSSPQLNE